MKKLATSLQLTTFRTLAIFLLLFFLPLAVANAQFDQQSPYVITVVLSPSQVTTKDARITIEGDLKNNGSGVPGADIRIEFRDNSSTVATLNDTTSQDGHYKIDTTAASLGLSVNSYIVQATGYVARNAVATTSTSFTYGSTQTGSNPTLDKIFGVVNHPSQLDYLFKGLNADQGITALLSKVVELIYIFAAVVFVFYILYSGIEFIYSEGHKESIAEARGRIIWAIIGIVILAIAFVFLKVLGYITGFQFFTGQ